MIAGLGLATSLLMLAFTEVQILIFVALLLFAGLIIYNIYRKMEVDVDIDVKLKD